MNEEVYETFEGLFKVAHRQCQRIEYLEARIVELEQRLQMQGRAERCAPLCAVPSPAEAYLNPQDNTDIEERERL